MSSAEKQNKKIKKHKITFTASKIFMKYCAQRL